MFAFKRFFSLCATAGWLVVALIGFFIAGAGFDRAASTRDMSGALLEVTFGGLLGLVAGFLFCQRAKVGARIRQRARDLRVMMANVTKGICTEG